MTLTSQKTSIQLLAPSYRHDFSEDLGMIVSNEGSQAYFSPFGFPIHGEYDDYGYISNIKPDKNVKLLEDYFGVDIELILNNIGDDRDIPEGINHLDVYQKLGKTYFRTEVLEFLSEGWNKINLTTPKKYSIEERLQKILKAVESKSSFDPNLIKMLEEKLRTKTATPEDIKQYWNLSDTLRFKSYDFQNNYISSQINFYNELNISLEFQDEIIKQYLFLRKFGYELNRILLPSNYGSQQDNWCLQYKLNDFVNELMYQDIKLRHERWGDDEYSEDEKEVVDLHKRILRDKAIRSVLD